MNVNKNDLITIAKARDMVVASSKRSYDFICSRFLSPAEQVLYLSADRDSDPSVLPECFFYGGVSSADRRLFIITPSYIDVSDAPKSNSPFCEERENYFKSILETYDAESDIGITALRISGSGYTELSHRDYMGSILALGIEREVIGDIAVTDSSHAIVLVISSIAPYICDSLVKIGRDSVSVEAAELPPDFEISRKFKTSVIVSASDRIDSVIASLTGTSRSEAKEMCLTGLAEINFVPVAAADIRVSPGDKISVRGYGKFIIDSFDGLTRSGRSRISVRKYI